MINVGNKNQTDLKRQLLLICPISHLVEGGSLFVFTIEANLMAELVGLVVTDSNRAS
jgi:hypothetical protein